MKKWISLLLVAVLCLSLAACSSAEEVSGNNEQGQQTSQNTQQVNPKPSVTEQKEQVIELTTENWQDYLEFRLFAEPTTNAFGEVTGVSCEIRLCLKDDIAQNVIDMNEVVLEYSLSGGHGCWYQYNVESNELTQKEPAAEGQDDDGYTGTGSFPLYLFEAEKGRGVFPGMEYSETIEGNTISFIAAKFENTEITRIQGTITISQ